MIIMIMTEKEKQKKINANLSMTFEKFKQIFFLKEKHFQNY